MSVASNYNRVKENFAFHILSFATQLWVSPTQDQIISSEQVECWRREAERILRTGSSWWVCPPKYCWVHLLVSADPSAHISSTSTTQARWWEFLSRKTEETLHSLQPCISQLGIGFPKDISSTMSGYVFGCHNQSGEMITGKPVDRGRGCCYTSCNIQVSSPKKDLSGPNVNSAKVEKACFSLPVKTEMHNHALSLKRKSDHVTLTV